MTIAQAGATLNQQGLGGLAPFFTSAFALNNAALGFAYGAIYLGSMLFAALSGVLVDRFGERSIVLGSGLIMAAAVASSAMVRNYVWLVAWFFIFGAAYAASAPAGGRAVLRWFRQNRGFAMGIRQAGAPVGGTLGAALLPFVAMRGGYQPAILLGAAICACTTVLAAAQYAQPPNERPIVQRPVSTLLRGMFDFAISPAGLAINVTAFLLASVQYTAVAFLIVSLLKQDVSRVVAASSLVIMQGTAVVARPLWGFVSDRAFKGDRTRPLAFICLLAAACSWLAGWIRGPAISPIVIIALSIGFGVSAVGFTGLLNTLLAEIGGIESAGSSTGVGLTFNYAAGFVTPPIFGAIVDSFGFPVAWRLLAGLVALGSIAISFKFSAERHSDRS